MFLDTHTEPENLPPASGSSESAGQSDLTAKEAAAERELREVSSKEEAAALSEEETAGQSGPASSKEETAGQSRPAPSKEKTWGLSAPAKEAQGRFLKNPLPLPERRPHVRMEFDLLDDWDIPEEEDHFDFEIREDDDFDL